MRARMLAQNELERGSAEGIDLERIGTMAKKCSRRDFICNMSVTSLSLSLRAHFWGSATR